MALNFSISQDSVAMEVVLLPRVWSQGWSCCGARVWWDEDWYGQQASLPARWREERALYLLLEEWLTSSMLTCCSTSESRNLPWENAPYTAGGSRRSKSGALAAWALVRGSLPGDPAPPASGTPICCWFTALMLPLLSTHLGAVWDAVVLRWCLLAITEWCRHSSNCLIAIVLWLQLAKVLLHLKGA